MKDWRVKKSSGPIAAKRGDHLKPFSLFRMDTLLWEKSIMGFTIYSYPIISYGTRCLFYDILRNPFIYLLISYTCIVLYVSRLFFIVQCLKVVDSIHNFACPFNAALIRNMGICQLNKRIIGQGFVFCICKNRSRH
jgi:hypothetical protein